MYPHQNVMDPGPALKNGHNDRLRYTVCLSLLWALAGQFPEAYRFFPGRKVLLKPSVVL